MSSSDKKLALFHMLSHETAPISLPDLLDKVDTSYSERSVRRWLGEWTTEGLIKKTGIKRSTKYQVVLKAPPPEQEQLIFSSESYARIEQVRRPIYERAPVPYIKDWLDSYQPNETFYIPHDVRLQLYLIGKRLRREDPAGTYAHLIFNRLLIDLSYNSSRLEGNTYSLLDTERLVLQGATAEGKLDEEKIMILNHKEAIRYLVDTAPKLAVSTHTLFTLHYLLSDGLVYVKHSGKIRDHTVRITGSTYIPLENPKMIKATLEQITEKAALILDPYEQSLFLLAHMSYLQAFSDVNKRTARLSSNIPLIKNNLVPLSFNDVERDDYASTLIAIYEFQDIQPLLDLYTFSYRRTATSYDSTVKNLGFDEVRVRYRTQRREIISFIITHLLMGKNLEEALLAYTNKWVQEKDRKDFLEDAFEDLHEMDLHRIVGLGITPEQLESWKKL